MNDADHGKLISVIVPVWNGRSHLADCLDSVLSQAGVDLEIWAVDNASADDSAGWLADHYSQIHLIRNSSNRGFSGACNIGLRAAQGNILLLLNQDTMLKPGCLAAILQAFTDQQIGVVGCKILYPDDKTIQHAGGKVDFPLGFTLHYGRGEPDGDAWDQPRRVDYVTGAAMAIRRDVLERIGFLDEGFWPGYFEDVDFCLRARAAGFGVWYAPAAVLRHRESTSIQDGASLLQFVHRARLRFVLKHLPPVQFLQEFVPQEIVFQMNVLGQNQDQVLRMAYLETIPKVDLVLREKWGSDRETIYHVISALRYLYLRTLGPDKVMAQPHPASEPGVSVPEPWRMLEGFPRIPALIFPEVNLRSRKPIVGALVSCFRRFVFNSIVRPALDNLMQQQDAAHRALASSQAESVKGLEKEIGHLAEENALLASELARLTMGMAQDQPMPYYDFHLDGRTTNSAPKHESAES